MTLFKKKYRIESARLKGWDYRNPGYYFVTVCTKNREHYFGHIANGEMHLLAVSSIVVFLTIQNMIDVASGAMQEKSGSLEKPAGVPVIVAESQ